MIARMDIDFRRFIYREYGLVFINNPFGKIMVREYWGNRLDLYFLIFSELFVREVYCQIVT